MSSAKAKEKSSQQQSTSWWSNREVYTHIIHRDYVNGEFDAFTIRAIADIETLINISYPTLESIKEKDFRLLSPRTAYQAEAQSAKAFGPYLGKDIKFLSFAWKGFSLKPQQGYILQLQGGVVLPIFEPVPTKIPTVPVPEFWFDGLVCRTSWVPTAPKLPLPIKPPKRFVLALPPERALTPALIASGDIFAAPLSQVRADIQAILAHIDPPAHYEFMKLGDFGHVARVSYDSPLWPAEDAYQNLFTLGSLYNIFPHPTIPPDEDVELEGFPNLFFGDV